MPLLEDVKVHYFDLPMLLAGGYHQFVSSEEKITASHFRVEEDRLMSLLSHGFLRYVLAQRLRCEPAEICLSRDIRGKPVLVGHGESLYFNLSHSGTSGLCAISHKYEPGVDLEAVRSFLPGHLEWMMEDCFTSHEKTLSEGLSSEKRLDLFFRFWVRKEAITKAMGTGLAFPLNQLDVSAIKKYPIRVCGVEPAALILTVRDIEVPAPYVAALCLKHVMSMPEPQGSRV